MCLLEQFQFCRSRRRKQLLCFKLVHWIFGFGLDKVIFETNYKIVIDRIHQLILKVSKFKVIPNECKKLIFFKYKL